MTRLSGITGIGAGRVSSSRYYCLAIVYVVLYRLRCCDPVGPMLHLSQRTEGKAMIEEAPNVVTEDGLRGLLGEGYLIEVVCKVAPEKRHNSWYGIWVVRAVHENGRDEKMLVTSRSYLKVREFKTIVGLVSFLAEMGCRTARLPLEQGGRERHAASGRILSPRPGPVLVKND